MTLIPAPPLAQSLVYQKILTPSGAEHGPEGVFISRLHRRAGILARASNALLSKDFFETGTPPVWAPGVCVLRNGTLLGGTRNSSALT